MDKFCAIILIICGLFAGDLLMTAGESCAPPKKIVDYEWVRY